VNGLKEDNYNEAKCDVCDVGWRGRICSGRRLWREWFVWHWG